MTSPAKQLAGFFARLDAQTARLGKSLRRKLRALIPEFFEIVYFDENRQSLVISYSPTERAYEGLFSLALYPDSVKLFFNRGGELSNLDPRKVLQGTGVFVRHIVISSAADLDRIEIMFLIVAASKIAKVRPVPGTKGSLIIKADSQEQRAHRATKSSRPDPICSKARSKR